MPGVRNISGEISTSNPGEFVVDLDTHYATLYFPGIFRHPQMNFSSITGRVSAALHSTPKFTFTDITAVSDDGTVRGSGTWESTGGAGTINISGTAEGVNGAAVHKYLPIVVGDPALDYVEAAVLAGRVSNGRWEVRGKLDDFPWDGAAPQEGHFLIEGDVTDGPNGSLCPHAEPSLARDVRNGLKANIGRCLPTSSAACSLKETA